MFIYLLVLFICLFYCILFFVVVVYLIEAAIVDDHITNYLSFKVLMVLCDETITFSKSASEHSTLFIKRPDLQKLNIDEN